MMIFNWKTFTRQIPKPLFNKRSFAAHRSLIKFIPNKKNLRQDKLVGKRSVMVATFLRASFQLREKRPIVGILQVAGSMEINARKGESHDHPRHVVHG